MTLACGCTVKPGVPLTDEEVKAHYRHTFEAMMYWELVRREGVAQDDRHLKLSQARAAWLEALEALYPEVQEEP